MSEIGRCPLNAVKPVTARTPRLVHTGFGCGLIRYLVSSLGSQCSTSTKTPRTQAPALRPLLAPTLFPSKKEARQESRGPGQGSERANLMRNYKLRPAMIHSDRRPCSGSARPGEGRQQDTAVHVSEFTDKPSTKYSVGSGPGQVSTRALPPLGAAPSLSPACPSPVPQLLLLQYLLLKQAQ